MEQKLSSWRGPRTTGLVCGALIVALTLGAGAGFASSHREAPFVTEHPKVDGTDFYMFRSYEEGRDGFVTLIANYLPLQDAYGGPNYFTFDPEARYLINIENDGDGVADLSFDFRFLNLLRDGALPVGGVDVAHSLRTITPLGPGMQSNEPELYVVRVIRDGGAPQVATNGNTGREFFSKPFDYAGQKTFADYADYAMRQVAPIQIPGCSDGRVFVGQRKESFAVNLGEVFDLVNLNPVGDEAAKRSATEDKNITSIILEVPIDCLTEGNGDVIGGWTTAHLPKERELGSGAETQTFEDASLGWADYEQVSRLGMPLVNEVVIGLPDKNRFNGSQPSNDLANFATYVTNPTIPEILQVLFGVEAPNNFPRNDLVATFVTGLEGINALGIGEMQRLNTAIPPTPAAEQSNFGVVGGDLAGFPNGRRPGDDVVDITLRVAMGILCHLDLGLCNPEDAPTGLLPYTDETYQGPDQFDDAFPYLRTPIAGSPNAYRTWATNLSGDMEVPPIASDGVGACTAVLTEGFDELLVTCTHTLGDAIGAHIHQAAAGSNGTVICDLGDPMSPIQAACPVDDAFLEALRRGNTYVNVHSTTVMSGELRGQLN